MTQANRRTTHETDQVQPEGLVVSIQLPSEAEAVLTAHGGSAVVSYGKIDEAANDARTEKAAVVITTVIGSAMETVVRLRRWIAGPIVMLVEPDALATELMVASQAGVTLLPMVSGYEKMLPYVLSQQVELTALRSERDRLFEQASRDSLTGLVNRRVGDDALGRGYAEATRYDNDFACLMIDLDGFKPVNDRLGHGVGDEVLRLTAGVLKACCRTCDTVYRYGGDEFVVLMPQTDIAGAVAVGKRIITAFTGVMRRQFLNKPVAMQLSVSVGAASLRESRPSSAARLLDQADQALAQAKTSGKHRVERYRPTPRTQVKIVPRPLRLVR